MHHQFDDGLDYDGVVAPNISKKESTNLFAHSKYGKLVDPRKLKVSIKWCTNKAIRTNFWDRCWIVFEKSPHKILEVPIYFLRKLYVEFVKNHPLTIPKMSSSGLISAPFD